MPPPSRPCLVQENGYVYARGQAFSSFGNKAFTASTTAMTFVPGCFEHEDDGKGRFAQLASSEFSGPSTTVVTSESRTAAPFF